MDEVGRVEEARAVEEESRPRGTLLRGLLAGLDTGVFGGFVALSFLALASVLTGDFWWARFNAAAYLFYGDRVFYLGLGRATWAGAALLLIVYALLGALFGILLRHVRAFLVVAAAALIVVFVWQGAADRFVWKRLNPFAVRYFGPSATLPAHMAYGLSLLRYRRRYRLISRLLGDAPDPPDLTVVSEPGLLSEPPSDPPAAAAGEKRGESGAPGLLE